eukprot:4845283-Ditylum_brightwellii.AAC.1
MNTCESCALDKARQKNVSKDSDYEKAKKPGERIFLDIVTIKGEKDGPKMNVRKHWRIMVDEYSSLNSPNSSKLKMSKDWKMALEFEFTARATPSQQNHLAELGFASLGNKGCSMVHCANVPTTIQYKSIPKVFLTATLLNGLHVVEIDGTKNL